MTQIEGIINKFFDISTMNPLNLNPLMPSLNGINCLIELFEYLDRIKGDRELFNKILNYLLPFNMRKSD
jgi:hypothetical protein